MTRNKDLEDQLSRLQCDGVNSYGKVGLYLDYHFVISIIEMRTLIAKNLIIQNPDAN